MTLRVKSNIPDLNRVTARLKRELPPVIANKAKNHYLEGFRRGGGQTDNSKTGWKARKSMDKQRGNRAILVKSGALRNDLDVRKTTFHEITLGTQDTVYASVHNNGEMSGRGAGFQMPQREFLGRSRILDGKIIVLIRRKMKKAYG